MYSPDRVVYNYALPDEYYPPQSGTPMSHQYSSSSHGSQYSGTRYGSASMGYLPAQQHLDSDFDHDPYSYSLDGYHNRSGSGHGSNMVLHTMPTSPTSRYFISGTGTQHAMYTSPRYVQRSGPQPSRHDSTSSTSSDRCVGLFIPSCLVCESVQPISPKSDTTPDLSLWCSKIHQQIPLTHCPRPGQEQIGIELPIFNNINIFHHHCHRQQQHQTARLLQTS